MPEQEQQQLVEVHATSTWMRVTVVRIRAAQSVGDAVRILRGRLRALLEESQNDG